MSYQALRLVKVQSKQRPEQIDELDISLHEYLVAIRANGLAKRTIEAYRWNLTRLADWMRERGVVSLSQVSRLQLREWNASLYDHWQPATVKRAVTSCRLWFRWALEEGLIADNPAEILKTPVCRIRPQRTIIETELNKMLDICDSKQGSKGKRDAAIISLLFDSGIRAAELCRLKVKNVDVNGKELQVQIKGGAVLPGWFGAQTKERLLEWLAVRDDLALPGVETLFVGVGGIKPGTPMVPDGLRRVLAVLGERAGIERVSAHAFRRGFACSLSAAGISDNVLKDLGRWSNTQMIKRYTLAQRVRGLYRSPVDHLKRNKRNQNSDS